jgi:hypothetical protein
MAHTIRRIAYFYTTVKDEPGEAYQLLSRLAGVGINLLGFTAVPFGPQHTQLTLIPDETSSISDLARKTGMLLDGPHPAFLVQGDDELGALAAIHAKLYEAGVNVYASSGVADGRGGYGYVLYVRPEQYERATAALEL